MRLLLRDIRVCQGITKRQIHSNFFFFTGMSPDFFFIHIIIVTVEDIALMSKFVRLKQSVFVHNKFFPLHKKAIKKLALRKAKLSEPKLMFSIELKGMCCVPLCSTGGECDRMSEEWEHKDSRTRWSGCNDVVNISR